MLTFDGLLKTTMIYKNLFLFCAFFFAFASMMAQESILSIYTLENEKFDVYVDGVIQTDSAALAFETSSFLPGKYFIHVVFENEKIPAVSERIQLMDRLKSIYKVGKNADGVYQLQFDEFVKFEMLSSEVLNSFFKESVEAPIDSLIEINSEENTEDSTNAMVPQENTVSEVLPIHPPKNKGNVKCKFPLNAAEFQSFYEGISEVAFEDSKLEYLKISKQNKCFTTFQIKTILKEFNFEDSRILAAKMCFPHCTNPENYTEILDVFDFSSSKEEIKKMMHESK